MPFGDVGLGAVRADAHHVHTVAYGAAQIGGTPQPGRMKVAILLWGIASRAVASISSSLSLAWPTWWEEAPNPLPWPTSTTGTPAASAAAA